MVRLGSVDAEGASLTSVAAIEPEDSLVLVLESDPPRVAVFGRGGKWLRDIGRAGDGPGELRRPTHLGRLGDTIWVGDPAGGRLELFGPTVKRRIVSVVRASGFTGGAGGADRAAGRRPRSSSPARADAGVGPVSVVRRVSPDAEVQRRLYRAVGIAHGHLQRRPRRSGGVVGRHPLEVSPLVAEMPDGSGIVVIERPPAEESDSSAFRVLVVASDGTVRSDTWIL